MSPRKAARFKLGTLVWFYDVGDQYVGTVVGTWKWRHDRANALGTRVESYGEDPRLSDESNGYLIMSSNPKVSTQLAFYADVTLGRVGQLC
jgi:hypothetical protein